jgi:hypothetical protein
MRDFINPRNCPIAIDANALDRDGSARDALVERLLQLSYAGRINLLVPKGVRIELQHPNTPPNVQEAGLSQKFTLKVGLNTRERALHRQIERALQGNARLGKHSTDADHLFEAAKYGGYFITEETRIRDKASKIPNLLPPSLNVVTLAHFIAIFDQFEARRRNEPLQR